MQNSSNNVVKIIKFMPVYSEKCLALVGAKKVPENNEPTNTERSNPITNDTLIINDNTNNLVFISCLLCPFFCLNEKQINEHIELDHRTRKPIEHFELKCPVCPNIFFHKLSLQAHLTYDHCLKNEEDITKTIVFSLFTKTPSNFTKNKIDPLRLEEELTQKVEQDLISQEVEEDLTQEVEEDLSQEVEEDLSQEVIGQLSQEVEEDLLSQEVEEDLSQVVEEDLVEENLSQEVEENKIIDCEIEFVDNITIVDEESDPDDNFLEDTANDSIETTKDSPKKSTTTITKILDKSNYFRCSKPQCNVRFQTETKLKYHASCHDTSIFKCPECQDDFLSWNTCAGHLWRKHKIDMDLHRCDKCDYRCYSLGKLNNTHKLIHSEIRGFTCTVCNKSFKNNKQMKNHQVSHRNPSEYVYSCKECKKTFGTRTQMNVHTNRVHKKIRPFLCSYCDYKGSTRSALKMHVRQHTGEKPFVCNECYFSTSDHNSLRRHKLLHSGEKPYKCTLCDYKCIQTSTYKAHISMKHPGLEKKLLFSCPVCQFLSISKDIYDTHVASQHPELKK